MSLFRRRDHAGQTADQMIPPRPGTSGGAAAVTNETALRHSAVWACLRLRANLISTMPVDVYRRVDGIQVEVPKPPVLVTPGGDEVEMPEWMYSSQFDLDRAGNTVGLITAKDGLGFPARIELAPIGDVTVRMRKGKKTYRIGGKVYQPNEVWHEKQYTVAGLPVGLSPVAYAAWSISEYLSIQQFALDWFSGGAIPNAHLKNTAKQLTPEQADGAKQRFKAAVMNRDLFVTGNDWDYEMIQAEHAGADWIAAKQASIGDIARYFDCPSDLIDAAVSGSSVTYANMTQRNLQFLVMSLGPAVKRREDALSRLTSRPRFVKLNTNALLRMDPQTQAAVLKTQIDGRMIAPSEARALYDRMPFTEDQLAEFDRLFGKGAQAQPTTATPQPGGTPS
ncbi:phage portal protein [Streptomyces sp. AMCC400023]|uniref:phage portal protein n=1 Tax=Streptomyces sp. AMCC400023 TaxID=2056258 RepID=UPI001F3EA5DD|nr:phage portal protein [Streptomyces sp. AMCC400023]